MSDQRPLALVTGASSGIGRAFAHVLAKDGYDVALAARREPELRSVAASLSSSYGGDHPVIGADLSTPDGVAAVVDALAGRELDVLVNNAGIGLHGRFVAVDEAQQRSMLAINVVALTELTRAFVPGMLERRRGRVLNVASTAAFQPGPGMAVYYASKAYVLSLSEALAEELAGTGVTVTALCPGPVPTEFQQTANLDLDTPLLKVAVTVSAEDVAAAGWAGAKRGRRIVIPGVANQLGAFGVRFAPRRLVTAMVKRLQPMD